MEHSLEKMLKKYVAAKEAYFNTGKAIMTDAEFDSLEEKIKKLSPEAKELKMVGAPISKKFETTLAVPLPSLSKVKSDSGKVLSSVNKLSKYGNYLCIMEKLDGASVVATYKNGTLSELATRGDGLKGKDISFLAPYCSGLPTKLKVPLSLSIRMEVLLPKSQYLKKYKDEYDSARAVVSGLLNRQGASMELRDLHFVALRVLKVEGEPVSLYEGLAMVNKLGFKTPSTSYVKISDFVTSPTETDLANNLNKMLETQVQISDYELDGLVVHADTAELPTNEDKPKFAFAFKDDAVADAPTTEIIDVEWNVSSFGILVPKAILRPVKFGGVTVKQASLHNAQWMKERGLGVGAKVKIIRSGEIIPKIISVVTPVTFKLPKVKIVGDYEWSGPNLKLINASNEMLVKRFERFISHCGMDSLGPAVAAKLVESGCPCPSLIFKLDASDKWVKLGFSSAMSRKYAGAVLSLQNIKLETLMAASGCFDKGLGERKILSLLSANKSTFKLLTTENNKAALQSIALETKGCGQATAKLLSEGYSDWRKFYKRCGVECLEPKKVKKVKGRLSGVIVSFTGYRDKVEELALVNLGAEIVSFGSKTQILLHRPDGKKSSKVEAAKAKGIKVTTFKTLVTEQFYFEYQPLL